jgi:glucokinase
LWRDTVDVAAGPQGIRRQIAAAVPELLQRSGIDRARLRGIGIGFGGPVDDATQTIVKSHQIAGWDGFPLARWISDLLGLPAALGNDADVAGLAEALHGAGQGLSPIFYITIGSGIGGGLIIGGTIYRGVGRGAAEIGHLRVPTSGGFDILEHVASGWSIENRTKSRIKSGEPCEMLQQLQADKPLTARMVFEAAARGDRLCQAVLGEAFAMLAEGICHVVALIGPRRIVIGGGVSLVGSPLFVPLRHLVAERVFKPFADCFDIVPAALGEEVVVHGALALASQRLG